MGTPCNSSPDLDSSRLVPICELLGQNFFIPAYQRGYRWESRQVQQLLDDIWEFRPGGQREFYCLQPVVVRRRDLAKEDEEGQDEKELRKLLEREEGTIYEVIDGQQRLTTIYLILKKLEEKRPFKIAYETRSNSSDFLAEITDKSEEDAGINIDYSHMHRAYQTIQAWFEKEQEGGKPNREDFETTLLEKTQVIWYLPEGDVNGAALFDRINRGKIPLTNAELIKALFMQEAKTAQDGLTDLKQLEIALTWDQMEYALRESDFWYFLKGKDGDEKKAPSSRVELLFELWAQLNPDVKYDPQKDDDTKLFQVFFAQTKGKGKKAITSLCKALNKSAS
jgi:uncharacterized protein with ParB-like and HNH nuclease domain